MTANVQDLITRLDLRPHPEGGYYRETWRSTHRFQPAGSNASRSAGSSILYLLTANDSSRHHRVRSDELWFYHAGDPLTLSLISPDGKRSQHVLGRDHLFQVLVPAGWIQSAMAVTDKHGFSLISCVVIPGFEFSDFELLDLNS